MIHCFLKNSYITDQQYSVKIPSNRSESKKIMGQSKTTHVFNFSGN